MTLYQMEEHARGQFPQQQIWTGRLAMRRLPAQKADLRRRDVLDETRSRFQAVCQIQVVLNPVGARGKPHRPHEARVWKVSWSTHGERERKKQGGDQ